MITSVNNVSQVYTNINSQVIDRGRANNEPICKFLIEETVEKPNDLSNKNSEELKWIGLINVYEDDKVLIQISDKNRTNLSSEELESLGWLSQVTIYDKTTKSFTIIDDVKMVEDFYNTFASFLKQNDVNIGDFIEYARSNLHSDLFDLFLEEIGWKVSFQKLVDESDINREVRTVSDNSRSNDISAAKGVGGAETDAVKSPEANTVNKTNTKAQTDPDGTVYLLITSQSGVSMKIKIGNEGNSEDEAFADVQKAKIYTGITDYEKNIDAFFEEKSSTVLVS